MMKTLALVFLVSSAILSSGCAQAIRMARAKDPLTSQEHMQLGRAYEEQKIVKHAEREYRAAIRKDKKNFSARMALGNLLFAEGRIKEARGAFQRAIKLNKGNAAASNNLAMTYVAEKKHWRKAERLGLQAAEDVRFRPYALDTLASIYIYQGRLAEAQSALEEARSLAPADHPPFLEQLEKTEQLLIEHTLRQAARGNEL